MAKFLILSQVAKHVAMPICSVTSELAFSTSAIDKFRSSLTPNTAKALICEQHWLWSTKADLHEVPINRLQLEVMVEVLEKLREWLTSNVLGSIFETPRKVLLENG
ncbi:zinc finger BED domain-containing protein RICESLEEPER 2-like protein [Tanacetum coccineum]